MDYQIWILGGVNTVLLSITAFFINNWINSVKNDLLTQENELMKEKEKNSIKFEEVHTELGKRKGEIALLTKDLEKLSSDTSHNFDSVKTHLNYQKQTLEEIRIDAKERKNEMESNFKNLMDAIRQK